MTDEIVRQANIPGTIGYYRTISRPKGDEVAPVSAISQAVADLREELVTMHALHAGKPVKFHIIATAEPLTDSAGGPIMTRGGG